MLTRFRIWPHVSSFHVLFLYFLCWRYLCKQLPSALSSRINREIVTGQTDVYYSFFKRTCICLGLHYLFRQTVIRSLSFVIIVITLGFCCCRSCAKLCACCRCSLRAPLFLTNSLFIVLKWHPKSWSITLFETPTFFLGQMGITLIHKWSHIFFWSNRQCILWLNFFNMAYFWLKSAILIWAHWISFIPSMV